MIWVANRKRKEVYIVHFIAVSTIKCETQLILFIYLFIYEFMGFFPEMFLLESSFVQTV